MNNTTFWRTTWLGALVAVAILSACGGGGGSSPGPTSRSYIGTQSPGDVWTWTLGSGTFSGENTTLGHTYSGTSTLLPSGYTRLDITASTDPELTVLPAVAYALEVPGDILLLKPATGDLVAAVARGGCPAPGLSYLGIIIPSNSWDVRYDKAYQKITSAPGAGGTFDFSGNNYFLDGTEKLPAMSATGFPCVDGAFYEPGTSAVIGVTPSGAMVGDFGPGAGGAFGIVQPAANVDIATVASQNYRGMLFKRIGGVDTTEPVGAEPGSGADAGRLMAFCFTDVETGARCTASSNGIAHLDSAAQPTPGLLRLQFTDPLGTHETVVMVNQIAGRYVLYGISVNGTNEPYNFILIQQ